MSFDKRVEFVLLFDVVHGNPNGDPDAGNAPRVDPETGYGIVTDVCLKRKIRNFVALTRGYQPPNDIYVKERGILAREQKKAYEAVKAEPLNRPNEDARRWMCDNYFDVRAFGPDLRRHPGRNGFIVIDNQDLQRRRFNGLHVNTRGDVSARHARRVG